MAAARGSMAGSQTPNNSPILHTEVLLPDMYLGILLDFQPDPRESSHSFSQPYWADMELQSLIRALPTKVDIVALIGTVEAAHRKELTTVKSEVKALTSRITADESSLSAIDHRVSALEELQEAHVEALVTQQVHLKDMEDRSLRNNLRLRGLTEAMGTEDLADTAIAIRKAWEAGDSEFDIVAIKILLDQSRATLQRRAVLRLLLDLAQRRDATYRWGYPLSVTFRNDQRSLRTLETLPALFNFLGTEPIEVPNWLSLLPRSAGRVDMRVQRGGFPPRQQRGRRRPRVPSPEGACES